MTGNDGNRAEAVPASAAEGSPRNVRFALPWFDENDTARVVETIRSGWVMQGPRVAEFEDLFAKAVGAPAAAATSSCPSQLLALGVGAGDVVLTVSHSFIATANVVRMRGAEPVFVDIDPVFAQHRRRAIYGSLTIQHCSMANQQQWQITALRNPSDGNRFYASKGSKSRGTLAREIPNTPAV